MAPDPGHLLSTSDNTRARLLAREQHPESPSTPTPTADSSRSDRGRTFSAYVADLVRADIELREFTPTQTPLEALFFMLTDTEADDALRPRARASHRQEAGPVDDLHHHPHRPSRTGHHVGRRDQDSLRRFAGRPASSAPNFAPRRCSSAPSSRRSPWWCIVHSQPRPPKDTLFGRFATENGFAMALLVLGFASQWVLPLLTAIVAGDIFASEDQHGTWKTVLTRSIGRSKLFWAKSGRRDRVRVGRAGPAGHLDHRLVVPDRRTPAPDRPVRADDPTHSALRWSQLPGPRWRCR